MSLAPQCTINSSTPPVAVTGGSTPTIALANATGVLFWGLVAIGCDETTSLAAINASIIINQVAKTATFTAPGVLGSCVIFQSTVGVSAASVQGAGRDANNVVQPTWTTTFKADVQTTLGLSVIAVNETTEENAVAGWIAEQNATTRAVSGAIPVAPGWVTIVGTTTLSTAQSGSNLRVNTSGGAYTLKLPPAPTDGCTFVVYDATGSFASHNLTLSGNGNNIVDPTQVGGTGATAATLALNLIRSSLRVTWDATNTLWQVS